jgi:dCMP deaminase
MYDPLTRFGFREPERGTPPELAPALRPGFDKVWLTVAQTVAQRGTCPRLRVGAVIVDSENKILSTGYNGAPVGLPHCLEVGCLTDEKECGSCYGTGIAYTSNTTWENCATCGGTRKVGNPRCQRTAHAEGNALLQADPLRVRGGAIYVTHFPCTYCAMLIIQSGLSRLVFVEPYISQPSHTNTVWEILSKAGVLVEHAIGPSYG